MRRNLVKQDACLRTSRQYNVFPSRPQAPAQQHAIREYERGQANDTTQREARVHRRLSSMEGRAYDFFGPSSFFPMSLPRSFTPSTRSSLLRICGFGIARPAS